MKAKKDNLLSISAIFFLLCLNTSCTKIDREPLVLDQGVLTEGDCFTYNLLIADQGEAESTKYGVLLFDSENGIQQNILSGETTEQKEISFLFDSLLLDREYMVWPFILYDNDTLFDNPSSFNTYEVNLMNSFTKEVTSSKEITFQVEISDLCSFKAKNLGISYSQKGEPTVKDSINFKSINSTSSYTFNLIDIKKDKMIFYRPYVELQNGQISYGEIISHNLQTIAVETTGNNNTSQLPASISFQAEITAYGDDSIDEFGIVYSTTTSSPNYNSSKLQITTPSGAGKYFASLNYPNLGTTYYYRAYARVGNKIYYGEIKQFIF